MSQPKAAPTQKKAEKKVQTESDQLFLKYNFYQVFALIFVVCGILVFAYMYHAHYSGKVMELLQDSKTPVIVLFTFLPGAILSFIAESIRRKAEKVRASERSQK